MSSRCPALGSGQPPALSATAWARRPIVVPRPAPGRACALQRSSAYPGVAGWCIRSSGIHHSRGAKQRQHVTPEPSAIFFREVTGQVPGDIDPDTAKPGLQVETAVNDPGVFTATSPGFVTDRRAPGGWRDAMCAENSQRFGNAFAGTLPQAGKPDFQRRMRRRVRFESNAADRRRFRHAGFNPDRHRSVRRTMGGDGRLRSNLDALLQPARMGY